MILKQVDVLPHGLINSPAKFGPDGQKFLEFLEWVVNRIVTHGVAGYLPRLHFDLYGTAGFAFDQDIDRVAAFLCDAGRIAKATQLCIESPMDFGGTPQQIEGYAALRQRLDDLGSQVKIAADEWCNTIEDVRNFVKAGAADVIQIKAPDLGGLDQSVLAIELCKREGVGAFLGGSCAETDLSARACVHIAVAAQAEMQLAKPGMGVDEGVMIVRNEQQRLLMQLALQEHTRFIAADSYVLNGPAL
jgi:methylaspartate ammonia-lyase